MSKHMQLQNATEDLESITNDTTDGRLSETEVSELLTSQRRRVILSYLQVCDGPVEIESLIEHLTYQELEECSGDTPTQLFEEIAEAVWNDHLPLLAEHDAIKYDRESGKLRGWTNIGQLAHRLREHSN
ncbi:MULTISPECIES: hypothetical protein [unclassified Haladaptatus]|uniref:DUF7344 domain-containing protein n=1 Tax=unclassified Haladaptatus TaxID=2622732 RepID=UPI00209C4171|nr:MULTISPECIES: hypothetical protein [unclassified Haladaptatus]MCO8246862.1 hypothetical protein [Haladaptatus sp. AB643]MCO8253612.1 hypothetical protein [Haladaptatus sp. AB618]